MIKITGVYPPLKFLAYTIFNILITYIIFGICRLVFFVSNIEYFPNIETNNILQIIKGGLIFDTAGIIYLNGLYVVLMLIPLPWRKTKLWQGFSKWIFLVINSIAIIINFADSVYFKYTNRRTTASVFSEFEKEENINKVIGNEILNNYILVILGILLIFAMYKIYRNPVKNNITKKEKHSVKHIILYYLTSLIIFVSAIPLCIAGIRGGFAHSTRPITIGNANQYVNRPIESAIVLNTPFSIIRTIGKTVYENPNYFAIEELKNIYSPIHTP
ncbi:MAG: LTA synthase family protein, partial [Muribaculaceae bacterium]|nr:LTA synthase family protein [Muribaculaceae bacterium]